MPRQRARHRRSVEPALKLLWEASTPDERHQRLHQVEQNRRRDYWGSERRRVDPGRRRVRLRALRHPALPWEIKQLQPSIQAMRGKQAAPLVRVAANEAYQICFALDAGARGIIAPMVNSRAEAEAMVRACRYFPLGNRSNAGVRGEWGEFKNYRDYLDAVNNELVVVPMIETNQSLENLDAIASVPGIDVLLIG